ncbi:hypothetical protein LY90DRAFT_676830 [Neocallimastix californiae]|jgi:hypothetical protein|uniref:CAAX prenyl protease 2/Lysostaphin resistance protein A-like domain-containing protein n=1 Tax=Neocallimastix californiae TaxID=1754190 RepID=A0A1Y2AEF7_9FUNG|nr:hypothetical protein LY90DRAFT_676830 [Neocallimastix californiae]|eukprot:ORY20325.1 hypothetical protein LY90DRAFT_676830 [Neocallimastix californiae]
MKELLNLLFIVIPCASSIPISLYMGALLENLNYCYHYRRGIILKKKNDDEMDEEVKEKKENQEDQEDLLHDTRIIPPPSPSTKREPIVKKEESDEKNHYHIRKRMSTASPTPESLLFSSSTHSIPNGDSWRSQRDFLKNTMKSNEYPHRKIPTSYKDCFSFQYINLSQPSKYYIYYSRFSLYFLSFFIILLLSKSVLPELLEIYTLKFWIPSKIVLKSSLLGFFISILFGHPWLDNPYLQIYTLNKQILCSFPCSSSSCSSLSNCFRKKTSYTPSTSYKKAYLTWNPHLHFSNESKRKALLLDIIRLICSSSLVPILEELLFRYIFYRFIIGGFNYQLVSFNTWRWTAAVLSNIVITHVCYIRCYEQGKAWITGLANGYLCTYAMIRECAWPASVVTHSLINLMVGLFVLTTRQYVYWS